MLPQALSCQPPATEVPRAAQSSEILHAAVPDLESVKCTLLVDHVERDGHRPFNASLQSRT